MISFLKFFISPNTHIPLLIKKSNLLKAIVILIPIITYAFIEIITLNIQEYELNYGIAAFIMMILYISIMRLIRVGVIYLIGIYTQPKISGSYIDNLFFVSISTYVGLIGIIFNTLSTLLVYRDVLFIIALLFGLWAFILTYKSLSKINDITELRAILLIISGVTFSYVFNILILTPSLTLFSG